MQNGSEGTRVFERDGVLADPVLSLFQKVLLVTDGSVTELLSIYTGQEIKARKIEQFVSAGESSVALGCSDATPLLHRKIMLVDRCSSYVYAESKFVFDRLSKRAQVALLQTDAPIGQLWREEKTEMYREIVDIRSQQCRIAAAYFGLPERAQFLSRTYVVRQSGEPLGVITEKFPSTSFM
ncbi:chorismate--pyruvate lyase family protein [Sorangium sp. So ce131]|uniref:chorismate--pyruvate lyase family protein n=1 Tax=Sorangium sp. So ce131 TaxID=3133282 RepID=UPI003F5F88D1